ncbi:MAG: polysaccharide deacetylase family protein [Chloroflexi bacterium]|nr:polysaccharide deacetylase family protein [Chloroflexota bacterium]
MLKRHYKAPKGTGATSGTAHNDAAQTPAFAAARRLPSSLRRLGTALLLAIAALALLYTAGPLWAEPRVPVSDQEVLRGNPDRPWVALVFNVGAGYEPGMSILDTLAEKEYRASFFVMGWLAERRPEVVRSIAERGHEIASHGHRIFDLTEASDDQIRGDLDTADAVISAITGRSTRPLWSPSAGYRNARVRRIAAEMGYRPILWTLDSGDWTLTATADAVQRKVLSGAQNGSIIVMHFDSSTTVNSTAKALPDIIDGLRGAGYRLVTITELLTEGTEMAEQTAARANAPAVMSPAMASSTAPANPLTVAPLMPRFRNCFTHGE